MSSKGIPSNGSVVFCITLCFCGALCGPCYRAALADVPPVLQHWEYASLLTSPRLAKWTSPEGSRLEEGDNGFVKLYADMGGTKPADKVTLIDLLNLIGERGWEMVAIDGGEGPHQYIFKRPRPTP